MGDRYDYMSCMIGYMHESLKNKKKKKHVNTKYQNVCLTEEQQIILNQPSHTLRSLDLKSIFLKITM